jgi:multidrug efflux pump
LRLWEKRIKDAFNELPELTDVNTDEQDRGLQTSVAFDRDTASRMGITPALLDTTLNDYFGQRQVSTIYDPLNQYRVIMEACTSQLAKPGIPQRCLPDYSSQCGASEWSAVCPFCPLPNMA